MKILDCTLRDGANIIGGGFSEEITDSVINALIETNIIDIEYGNCKGLSAYRTDHGSTALSDEAYMRIGSKYKDRARLGMFVQPKFAIFSDIALAAQSGLTFLRVGIDAGNGNSAIDTIHAVKSVGLACRFSMMKAYVLSPVELAQEARCLEKEGVDAITIMDSAGTMTPKVVIDYVRTLKETVSIPVGFHGHNNLGLSQANAVASIDAGVDEIDCGLLGLARCCGNCSTELTMAAVYKEYPSMLSDLMKLLNYLDNEFIPKMEKLNYKLAITPKDIVLGIAGCHSSFFDRFRNISNEMKVPLYPLILAVSKINAKDPSIALIQNVASNL